MPDPKTRKWGGFFLRLIISALLIYWLLTFVDLRSTIRLLLNADLPYIVFALIAFFSAIVFFALRWQILLRGLTGHPTGLLSLIKYYLIGMFFNNFLPTSIGGDIVRAYYVSHDVKKKGESFASVVLERIFGFGLTAILSLSGILIIGGENYGGKLVYIVIFLVFFVAALILFLMYEPFFAFLTGWMENISFFSIGEKLKQVFRALRNFRNEPSYLLKALFFTFIGQLLIILFNLLLFRSIALGASFFVFLFVVPLTMIASLFPSINGLGTRETAYVVLLGAFGVAREPALGLAIFVYFVPLFVSIAGGILYITGNVSLRAVPWEESKGE